MNVTSYLSFVIELSYTFQCLRDYYIIDGSSLNTLRAYFVLSLDAIHVVTSKLPVIKDNDDVVRLLLLLRCSLLYTIYFGDSFTCVLLELDTYD